MPEKATRSSQAQPAPRIFFSIFLFFSFRFAGRLANHELEYSCDGIRSGSCTTYARLIAHDEMYAHICRSVCYERGRKVGLTFRWPENECVTQPTTSSTENIVRGKQRERTRRESQPMPRQTNKPKVFFFSSSVKLLSHRAIVAVRASPQFSLFIFGRVLSLRLQCA